MIRKLIILTLCLSLGLMARAEATDISQYENVVFPVPTTGSAGSAVTVSVEMNNTVNATGFQFDIVLPEGITVATDGDGFYLIALSETRTTSKKTDFFSSALQTDGSVRVMCSSTQSYTFSGNEARDLSNIYLAELYNPFVCIDKPNGDLPANKKVYLNARRGTRGPRAGGGPSASPR